MQKSKSFDADTLGTILHDLGIALPPELGGNHRWDRPEFPAPKVIADGECWRVVGSPALVAAIEQVATAEIARCRAQARMQKIEKDADDQLGAALEKAQAGLRQTAFSRVA